MERGAGALPMPRRWWVAPCALLLCVVLLATGCSIRKGSYWMHDRTEHQETIRAERCTASARLVAGHHAMLQLWCEQDVDVLVVEIWKQMERRKRMTGFWWAFGGTVTVLTLFILLLVAAGNSSGSGGGGGSSWDWDD
jgi:hypothetical protein